MDAVLKEYERYPHKFFTKNGLSLQMVVQHEVDKTLSFLTEQQRKKFEASGGMEEVLQKIKKVTKDNRLVNHVRSDLAEGLREDILPSDDSRVGIDMMLATILLTTKLASTYVLEAASL